MLTRFRKARVWRNYLALSNETCIVNVVLHASQGAQACCAFCCCCWLDPIITRMRLESSWLESSAVTESRAMVSTLVSIAQCLYIWPMLRAIVCARNQFELLHVSILEHVAGRSTKLADSVKITLQNTQKMRLAYDCLDRVLLRIHLTRVTWSVLQLRTKLPATTLNFIAESLVEGAVSLLDHEDPDLNFEVVTYWLRADDRLSFTSTSALATAKALAQASVYQSVNKKQRIVTIPSQLVVGVLYFRLRSLPALELRARCSCGLCSIRTSLASGPLT